VRKAVFAVLLVCGVAVSLPAQMLTRFAVVDMNRVHSVFFMESGPVRALEVRAAEIQAEINRRTQEIQGLQAEMANAVGAAEQRRFQDEIRSRTEALRDFHATRTAELEAERRELAQTDAFMRDIYNDIRFVAEREGFSMVFDLRQTPGLLWFSPTVDITEVLIQRLLARPR